MTFITDVQANANRTDYFNGTLTPIPALSQSIAVPLVTRSPKHAWAKHPRLGGMGRVKKPTARMKFGTVLDEVLIGGEQRLASVDVRDKKGNPYKTFSSDAAKAKRDRLEALGLVPLFPEQLAGFRKIAADVTVALSEDHGFDFGDYKHQVCMLWTERATNGNEVQCCCLLDLIEFGNSVIVDLKTGDDINPEGGRLDLKCFFMGYEIQAAAYLSALAHLDPGTEGRAKFKHVFVEQDYPHTSLIYEMSGGQLAYGRRMWQLAIDKWEHALRTNHWPGYVERGEVVRGSLPSRAQERMLLAEFDETAMDKANDDDDDEQEDDDD